MTETYKYNVFWKNYEVSHGAQNNQNKYNAYKPLACYYCNVRNQNKIRMPKKIIRLFIIS